MEDKYLNLVRAFRELDVYDKRVEIVKELHELLNLLYYTNWKLDTYNKGLPTLNNYDSDEEFLNVIFTYIVSLKEENAKIIDKII